MKTRKPVTPIPQYISLKNLNLCVPKPFRQTSKIENTEKVENI